MNQTIGLVLWMGLGVLAIGDCYADWHVWTVTDTRRVMRDEPAGTATEVRISVARNQWRGFQVLVRSEQPMAGVRLEPGDLKGPSGSVIRSGDARLYRQHQFELIRPTYRNDQFKPGWYPDALIPVDHPLTRTPRARDRTGAGDEGGMGPRLLAVPFALPANQTHGFWIDLYAPPDAMPGQYRGVYRLSAEGGKASEIAVAITVWDFQLPTVPTFRTALGSPAGALRRYYQQRARQGQKAPADWAAVEAQCAELVSRHRINASPPPLVPAEATDGTFRISDKQVDAVREFVDRYHVNAVGVEHPSYKIKNPVVQRIRLHSWLKSYDQAAARLNRPHVLFYTYLKDEPNTKEEYQYVQTWGRAIREAGSVVKVLVVEQPQTQDPAWGDLYGAVDIWCPLFSLFQPEPAARRLALGETIWTYTALCQGKPTPWWHIDYPLLNYRVPAWIA